MPLGLCRALEALAEAMRPAAGACAGAPAAACGSDDCSTATGESSDAVSDDEQLQRQEARALDQAFDEYVGGGEAALRSVLTRRGGGGRRARLPPAYHVSQR